MMPLPIFPGGLKLTQADEGRLPEVKFEDQTVDLSGRIFHIRWFLLPFDC